ncbi:MAG: hypothetical protein ACRDIV_23020 [Ktedonobacteraceae bacterium]
MSTQQPQPLTRELLAKEYQWSQFPEAIQQRLYIHYTTFVHEGDLRLAERDIQSASDALSWVILGTRLAPFLIEHRQWFGEASTDDLADMAKQLVALSHPSDQRSS